MGTYKNYKTASNKEISGVEIDLLDSGKFVVARAGGANTQYEKRAMQALKPHRRAVAAGLLDEAQARAIMIPCFVDCCLRGWSGVTGEDGQPLAYSRENAIKLFTDLPDLFSDVKSQADNQALFRADALEIESKN